MSIEQKVQYKWQQEVLDRIHALSNEDLVDEALAHTNSWWLAECITDELLRRMK